MLQAPFVGFQHRDGGSPNCCEPPVLGRFENELARLAADLLKMSNPMDQTRHSRT